MVSSAAEQRVGNARTHAVALAALVFVAAASVLIPVGFLIATGTQSGPVVPYAVVGFVDWAIALAFVGGVALLVSQLAAGALRLLPGRPAPLRWGVACAALGIMVGLMLLPR